MPFDCENTLGTVGCFSSFDALRHIMFTRGDGLMFSVLVLDNSVGFFARRKLYRHPQVRDVRAYGGLPFREIISAKRRGEINRDAVCSAAGGTAEFMILPQGITPSDGIKELDSSLYIKLVFFNTACELLRRSVGCGVRATLCIKDKNAAAAGRLSLAVPLVSDVRVATDCYEAYSRAREQAINEYGAAIVLSQSECGDITIDLDADEPCLVVGEERFTAEKITLPTAYARLMPPYTDELKFAAGLYQISRIYSLSALCFDKIFCGGVPIEKDRAAVLISHLMGL